VLELTGTLDTGAEDEPHEPP
jgi:hypothetical protein